MLLVMTTHELLLLYHGGLSASLLIIIVWLPVLSTVLRPCHVKLLSQTFTVLSHHSYQPKVDDSFQDLVIHMKGRWCLVVHLPCCCNVLLSTSSAHYMKLSFILLLHVQFLCLFTCRSAIILVNVNCRCAVVTVGCDRLETLSKEQVCCCWVFRTWDRPHFGGGCVRNIGISCSAREKELIFEHRS